MHGCFLDPGSDHNLHKTAGTTPVTIGIRRPGIFSLNDKGAGIRGTSLAGSIPDRRTGGLGLTVGGPW